jgi:hypothetical protein
MFQPNVTIADQNYLGRGVLLLVTPTGRQMVRHTMNVNHMLSKWYIMRRGPRMLFLQGDWNDDYDGRTLMFIETGGDVSQFIHELMTDANNTESALAKMFAE